MKIKIMKEAWNHLNDKINLILLIGILLILTTLYILHIYIKT